jgi:type IV secretory pathway TrbL component
MSSLTKFGSRVRALGQKITGGIRNIGQKISGVALRLAPALTAFNPALGAAAAAVGGIAGGVSRIAGAAEGVLDGRNSMASAARNIQAEAAAVKQAYGMGRAAVSSALERRR